MNKFVDYALTNFKKTVCEKSLDPNKMVYNYNVKKIVCAILDSLTHLVSHENGKIVAASLSEKLCLIITAASPGYWVMKHPAVASLAGE
jgi:hypothetical protein